MKPYSYEPAAEEELEDALARSADPSSFQRDVQEAIDSICKGIIVHRKVGRGNLRECVLSRLPYIIMYRDEPHEITIVAFAHKRRRRGYWKSRLKKS
ncbi:MAG: type II toxin-antitoxin system RelE/ParE family toxin [Gemmataceae bacterium]